MKHLFILLLVSLLVSILISLEIFVFTGGQHYPIIWSLLLIPHIIITVSYPRWKIIIAVAFTFSVLKYSTVTFQQDELSTYDFYLLHLSTLINWSVFLTVAYFTMKYHHALEEVKRLTIIDSLTGLHNRRYFKLMMEKVISISQKTGNPLVLILLDIDHFKKVNDNYGHHCGDEAIKYVSEIIKNTVNPSDTYVRYGGEEFAIILPNTNLIDGQLVAEYIREAVENSQFIYQNTRIHLTVSLGVAMFNGEKEAEFTKNADKALYQAKEDGRNQVAIYKKL